MEYYKIVSIPITSAFCKHESIESSGIIDIIEHMLCIFGVLNLKNNNRMLKIKAREWAQGPGFEV